MTIESQLILSYYKEIAEINAAHGICLVQHQETGKIFVKKLLTIFNTSVFQYLKAHPVKNTPRIYEVIEDESGLILIEEYIPGSNLQELLKEQGVFPEDQVRDICLKLCAILHDLHSCQPAIIHRDLKPSNIMLTPDGVIKLLDFNAARYLDSDKEQDTRLLGTQGYAAPEQYGFGTSNVEADIYALGITMNTLLTGFLSRETVADGSLNPVIRKCIMINPCDRYQSVCDLQKALGDPGPSSPKSTWIPPGFRSRNPFHILLALSGYTMILGLGVTLELNTHGAALTWERVNITLAMLSMVLFSANYRNIQKNFPLCSSRHVLLRITGIILADALIFTLWVLFAVIIEGIFF